MLKSIAIKPNIAVATLCIVLFCTSAFATTKGLNQIVTPDIQPEGVLSVSFQGENNTLGNSEQLQLEIGVTPSFEIAVFRGFKPGENILGAEVGLVKSKSFLLSTGILGVENRLKPQPFLEAGYYNGKGTIIAGVQEQYSKSYGVFGAAYQAAPVVLVTADYISGSTNFATLGVTLTLTGNLSWNPAIYISNQSPRRAYSYSVVSWNVKAW